MVAVRGECGRFIDGSNEGWIVAKQHWRPGRLNHGIACALLAMMAHGTTAAQDAVFAGELAGEAAAVAAVWKPQEINFYYQSFTTFYSCASLAEKVKRLLLALGANRDLKVRSTGCESSEIARMPVVRIRLSSPAEATPQTLAELEKTRSVRELIARVRGESAAGIEAAAQFPAHWKPVSLSRGDLALDSGDCELIDEFKRKVLPKLSIRVVRDGMRCTPHQFSLGQPRLEVEALTAVPATLPDAAEARLFRKKEES